MIEVASSRRIATAFTYVRRANLTRGGGSARPAPVAFLRELRSFDKDLECHFNAWVRRWVLYRRARRGLTPSGDMLLKEFEVVGPAGEYREPGFWLVAELRRRDKLRLYGTQDPEYADRRYLADIAGEEAEEDARFKKSVKRVSDETAKEIEKYGIDDRKHFPQGELSAKGSR